MISTDVFVVVAFVVALAVMFGPSLKRPPVVDVPPFPELRQRMANRGEVNLGDEAKDTITGLSGVIVAITTWLNGCQRITIQPRELKDGKPVESSTFDVEQVEVTNSVKPIRLAETGGPHDEPARNADPRR